jgi:hypothetical protein
VSKRAVASKGGAVAARADAVVAGADADRDAAVAVACDADADAVCAITSIVAQRHRFAAVDALASTASAPVVDLTRFFTRLETAMTGLAGLPCRITTVDDADRDLATTENVAWYTAPDGGWLGIALSTTLAEALVNQRCGGELAGDDGRLSGTASVLRLQAELKAVILCVAAASWLPVEGEWASATTATAPPLPVALPTALPKLRAMMITIGDLRCPLGIAVALASPVTSAALPAAWAHDQRRSLDHLAFPVRAVLFETRLPLAKAAQLRPGDVLPIETPRDVGLRVGAYRLASGTVTPTGDGGHLVTIRAHGRSFRQSPSEKAPS